MEEAKGMTQEQVEELHTLFEDAMNSFPETMEMMWETQKRVYALMIVNAIEKLTCIFEKYASATWVTKWYWKREMRRFVSSLPELVSIMDDAFNKEEGGRS